MTEQTAGRWTRSWRTSLTRAYRSVMGRVSRKGRRRIEPVARPSALDAFAGQWVAVKDGRVIAHAHSARDVVAQMRVMGDAAEGAVLQRAASPTEALAVGMGWASGILGGHGFFDRWVASFNYYDNYFVVEERDAFAARLGVDLYEVFQREPFDSDWRRPTEQ